MFLNWPYLTHCTFKDNVIHFSRVEMWETWKCVYLSYLLLSRRCSHCGQKKFYTHEYSTLSDIRACSHTHTHTRTHTLLNLTVNSFLPASGLAFPKLTQEQEQVTLSWFWHSSMWSRLLKPSLLPSSSSCPGTLWKFAQKICIKKNSINTQSWSSFWW